MENAAAPAPDQDASRHNPLQGTTVVSLAPNLPGPAAARRLAALGACVTKIESPRGDLMATANPAYYEWLCTGQRIEKLDLKSEAGLASLDAQLSAADLLLTSSRPRALARLGLGWEALHDRFPQLSHLAIVGYAGERANEPGHDLTYQAAAGTLQPPALPTILAADVGGGERAVSDALALLHLAQRTGEGHYAETALATVITEHAQGAHTGTTAPGGPLGGGIPTYGLYRASDGDYVALAALEPHFHSALLQHLGGSGTAAELTDAFAAQPADYWHRWGKEHGLPLVRVQPAGGNQRKDT